MIYRIMIWWPFAFWCPSDSLSHLVYENIFAIFFKVSMCPYLIPSPSISARRKYYHKFSDNYFLACLHSFARCVCMTKYTFILACFEHYPDAFVPYVFPLVMGNFLIVTLGSRFILSLLINIEYPITFPILENILFYFLSRYKLKLNLLFLAWYYQGENAPLLTYLSFPILI